MIPEQEPGSNASFLCSSAQVPEVPNCSSAQSQVMLDRGSEVLAQQYFQNCYIEQLANAQLANIQLANAQLANAQLANVAQHADNQVFCSPSAAYGFLQPDARALSAVSQATYAAPSDILYDPQQQLAYGVNPFMVPSLTPVSAQVPCQYVYDPLTTQHQLEDPTSLSLVPQTLIGQQSACAEQLDSWAGPVIGQQLACAEQLNSWAGPGYLNLSNLPSDVTPLDGRTGFPYLPLDECEPVTMHNQAVDCDTTSAGDMGSAYLARNIEHELSVTGLATFQNNVAGESSSSNVSDCQARTEVRNERGSRRGSSNKKKNFAHNRTTAPANKGDFLSNAMDMLFGRLRMLCADIQDNIFIAEDQEYVESNAEIGAKRNVS